jgi:hypothetical protein
MRYKITRHAALRPPDGVMDLLSERIPARRDGVLFSRAGEGINARLDRDEEVGMTMDERSEIGREAVLEVVGEVCERSPELKLDWYAISPSR